jgi:hypothetical protein
LDRLEEDGLIIRRPCRHGIDLPDDPEDPHHSSDRTES